MGVDFSGLIKIYLYKFNNEIKEVLKDKSLEEKESIFLEKLTSLFLSKYIIIIFSEKNLNPYYYFINICFSINENTFLKIYFPFLDNLIENNFVEKIIQYNEKNDEILEIMKSLTEELKDINNDNLEVEKLENDLYTNKNNNLIEFYSTALKTGIDFLTSEKSNYVNIINNILKSSDLLNISERKTILNGLIEVNNLKKTNYIQQILILFLMQMKEDDIKNINDLIESYKRSLLIKILERIKSKDNELQKDISEFITNSKTDFINIDDLIKLINPQ